MLSLFPDSKTLRELRVLRGEIEDRVSGAVKLHARRCAPQSCRIRVVGGSLLIRIHSWLTRTEHAGKGWFSNQKLNKSRGGKVETLVNLSRL